MSNFFVIGLPRCRTTWLSAYMHSKDVFCGHEVFSHPNYDSKDFWNIEGYIHKGCIDNDPRYAKPYLIDWEAPVVVIDRDCKSVYRSLVDKCGLDKRKLKSTLYEMDDALTQLKRTCDLIVKYKDIDKELEAICELCTPEVPYDPVKHVLLKHMSIETKLDPDIFNRGI
jgi:hypothetical protein